MSLGPEALQAIEEEESTLTEVLNSLRQQLSFGAQRYRVETARARDLTSQIANSRRDSDKQMLSSDEAVSHELSNTKRHEIKTIDKLLDQPYFARVTLEEERDGRTLVTEYKLGTAANSDCRIIDWRKAPIAKLYYEYKEDEEFCELIQGRERTGTIKKRNKIGIRKGELKSLSCREGEFVRIGETWNSTSGANRQGAAREYSSLRSIVQLITPEQFRMITEDADSAVLIQGIAGSGKTTVALHRLAWLLHEDNSDLKPQDCAVLVLGATFRNYIATLLPELGIEGVSILTFREWAQYTLRRLYAPSDPLGEALRKKRIAAPPSVLRLKRSAALVRAIESYIAEQRPATGDPDSVLQKVFSQPQRILSLDESKLIDRELISDTAEFTKNCREQRLLDRADDPLLMLIAQLLGNPPLRKDGNPKPLDHIVADEVQDYSLAELETILAAVPDTSQLTLVGDTHQQIAKDDRFPGWEAIRNHPQFAEAGAVFTQLTVSHRSTLPIMRLADYISGQARTTEGRRGKVPIWFKCRSENEGVKQALLWLERVLERYPGTLVAVLCRTPEESRHVCTLLEPTFGSAVRLGSEDSFSFGEGIVVTDVAQVKGLEFPFVLIWNPVRRWYPPTQRSRNMLYVAVSRAEELLCMVSWEQPSPLLPGIRSELVRGYEPDADPNE